MAKEVYNPKAVIPHAASLRQASAHCAIFPTAASRRSLGRVSVPVWPVALSGRLPVVALVGHHPTNKLIGRGPISSRKTFHPTPCRVRSYPVLDPVSQAYPRAEGRSPTCYSPVRRSCTPPKQGLTARLACVKHAASVRPEPGSNSPKRTLTNKHNKQHGTNKQKQTLTNTRHTVEFSKDTRTPSHTLSVFRAGPPEYTPPRRAYDRVSGRKATLRRLAPLRRYPRTVRVRKRRAPAVVRCPVGEAESYATLESDVKSAARTAG